MPDFILIRHQGIHPTRLNNPIENLTFDISFESNHFHMADFAVKVYDTVAINKFQNRYRFVIRL